MRFAFIGAEKARHSVPMLCRMLRVSRSGYYAWRRRGPSRRALEDARLGTLIVASHREGRGTYGSPRILDDLREAGERVSRKRVARLMKERDLVGEMKKRWRHPSSAPSDAVCAPNILDRAFNVPQPNRVWASDIIYVHTYEGWLYLAVVIDLFSRRVVGWSIQASLHTDIVRSALTMAVGQRLPGPGLLQHSDRGSQYTSDDYQRMLRSHGNRVQLQRSRQLLGQCRRRELLRNPEARAHSPSRLADPEGGRPGHSRVHRGLLQPSAPPHDFGREAARDLRGPCRKAANSGSVTKPSTESGQDQCENEPLDGSSDVVNRNCGLRTA